MNSIKTVLLMTMMIVLLTSIGGMIGGRDGMFIMFGISLVMNFASYWFSDTMVLKAYRAEEATEQTAPELFRMVANLAKNADLPMPKVYTINTDVPNAFATGRNPSHAAVAVTSGIMRALNYEELEGVLSHELSHVKHRDTLISTLSATMAGTISMLANAAQWGAMMGGRRDDEEGGGSLIGTLIIAILAPFAAMLIQMAISRSREYMADESGAHICGKPLALASALQKIEMYAQRKVLPSATPATSHMFIINPLAGIGGMMNSMFSTHPATPDRIARLQEIAREMK